ncbi:phosphatidylinositol mannoside acyltransferase [Micromonospora sp. WMMD998]|uniref:phosphatidylinositol mannoside acyltransferase n=1 Tax=Micromonospora sp. WMMD998 TaxID=3016092 RepID=UPI00249A51C5|nr:phosphatidylinositol mannoside acyltransferase [Micromonospora sp. WMMD998]WFE39621.1 phosphatidylinositol mannoside acyltransferase [Micromonospora sp. WMMD998]
MNLTEAGFVAGWRLIRALPRPVAATAFRVGADRAHRKNGGGTRRLRANLRRVVGPELPEAELDALVRAGLRSYARYWLEAFRLPGLSRAEILAGFRLDGAELLAADVAAGRGAVVALPHAGNWDAAGAWVAATGWPMTTVAERLPDGVYERFVGFREGLGMEILPNRGGARPAFDVLVDRLRAGYVVPLLADRDLSARGVEVDFFGGRTRMPPGPALLALRTGAPLYVASMWYEPDAAHASIEGPLALPDPDSAPLDARVRVVTQRIADGLAAGIARHPQDWHMLQRMWLDQGPGGAPTSTQPPAATGTV